MTARKRLLPDSEIDRVFAKLKQHGIRIGAVDIRGDGMMVYDARHMEVTHNPPTSVPAPGSTGASELSASERAYEERQARKKAKGQADGGSAHR